MNMTVLAHDPYQKIDPDLADTVALNDLLARSDFVHLTASATPETQDLMDATAFQHMKRGSFFINVSRSSLVDDSALAEALTSGHLAGAALDVGSAPDQKPSPQLARLQNVIATPHIGGQTRTALMSQAMETVEQVRAVAEGRLPLRAINADQASRFQTWIGSHSTS
jgi:D-3-phosphoglycerate dehydrogenase